MKTVKIAKCICTCVAHNTDCPNPRCQQEQAHDRKVRAAWRLNSARKGAWIRIQDALLEAEILTEEQYCADWSAQ